MQKVIRGGLSRTSLHGGGYESGEERSESGDVWRQTAGGMNRNHHVISIEKQIRFDSPVQAAFNCSFASQLETLITPHATPDLCYVVVLSFHSFSYHRNDNILECVCWYKSLICSCTTVRAVTENLLTPSDQSEDRIHQHSGLLCINDLSDCEHQTDVKSYNFLFIFDLKWDIKPEAPCWVMQVVNLTDYCAIKAPYEVLTCLKAKFSCDFSSVWSDSAFYAVNYVVHWWCCAC